jgi:type IV pilus biogenesis protein CpaD/CtpE
MNIDRRMTAALLLGAVLLGAGAAGCTPTDATFGNAVRQTMAAQVVNPDPQYDTSVPTTEAAKAAAAVDRYRTDKVKQPDTIRTTDSKLGAPR